ncbi:putative trehalose-phosphate phosphatase C [Cinnamomum micranthum f. kanehirae]|uniref:Trehalose 6-phosphate phosphatase n=1 Tax=Cinnamomum micranthum f. kanehirae TaxID=337451 RepID=A0A443Q0G1_9MAGN|nr:putative trehalose-phosphate phosphatase C [Cinnamomum micranthum f. kanehirae]
MGFQWLRLGQQKMESISKARCDENGDWLTVEKSPATTNLQQTKGSDPTNTKDGTLDINYIAWTIKYPSALRAFDQMMNVAKGKRIVVFLDYDGTLSPIVADPDQAFMTDAMRSAVGEVARHFPTAIISGRCRDKVHKFVQLANVYYAGSHGMDIMAPVQPIIRNGGINKFQTRSVDENGREAVLFQPAKEFLPTIQEIFRVLQERTKVIHGAMIENNRFCLSVHFRRVSHEDWSKLEELVKSVAMQYPQFCLTRGRKVMEIRPSIKWDKGHALEYLLDTLGFGNSTDVLPLYIGDDLTDEDAFQVLQRRGQGYPIIVSSIPKDTKASYSLRDPSEVMAFLLCLARWKRNSSSNSLQL